MGWKTAAYPHPKRLSLYAAAPETLFSADKRFNTEASLLRSTNGGRTWDTLLQNGDTPLFDPAGLSTEVIGIDPGNSDRVFVGTGAHVVRTEDAGAT